MKTLIKTIEHDYKMHLFHCFWRKKKRNKKEQKRRRREKKKKKGKKSIRKESKYRKANYNTTAICFQTVSEYEIYLVTSFQRFGCKVVAMDNFHFFFLRDAEDISHFFNIVFTLNMLTL